MNNTILDPTFDVSFVARAQYMGRLPRVLLDSDVIMVAAVTAITSLPVTVAFVVGHPGWRRYVQGASVR